MVQEKIKHPEHPEHPKPGKPPKIDPGKRYG